MKPVLSSALYNLLHGDSKPHPVEGAICFIVLITAVLLFDKLVIRKEKNHERHYKSDKVLKKERSVSKSFWHSFLQMIEFFCGIYFRRGLRWNDEPFRKATETEKRIGACVMVLWPASLVVGISNTKSIDTILDSMMYGHLWMGWLYLGWIALIGGGVLFVLKIAPKIPLSVSVPLALASWSVLAWVIWKHNLI